MNREDPNRILRRSGHGGPNRKRSAAPGRRALVLAAAAILCAALVGAALAASTNFIEPATSPEPVGDFPHSVAAADLDGDGDSDLAVANWGSDDVTILRNNGAGDLSEPVTSPEPFGDNPVLVAADLDGDGDQDLAVVNGNVGPHSPEIVTILRNNGAGDFVEPASSPEPVGRSAAAIAAADLDGDGDQDLAVTNYRDRTVTILRNNGVGNFVEPASSPERIGGGSHALAAADLDGDGDRDLAVAIYGGPDASVQILSNNGAADFTRTSRPAAGNFANSVAAADLDGDGDRDLAVVNRGSPAGVTILRNNGTGRFSQPGTSPEAAGYQPDAVTVADFDGDGDSDLAVDNEVSDDVTILRNNGVGNFSKPATSPEAAGDGPSALAAADFDGDGDPDLAVANRYSDDVTILLDR